MMADIAYVGIDPGMTRVALTHGRDGGEWHTEVFTYRHKRATDRLHELGFAILDFAERMEPCAHIVLAMEAPLGQLHGQARWLPAFWWEMARVLEQDATSDDSSRENGSLKVPAYHRGSCRHHERHHHLPHDLAWHWLFHSSKSL